MFPFQRHITSDATEEVKFDGFRSVAYKSNGKVHLRSRNDKGFNVKYPAIVRALQSMPDETLIEGEIVALDDTGRPSFSAFQNYGSATGCSSTRVRCGDRWRAGRYGSANRGPVGDPRRSRPGKTQRTDLAILVLEASLADLIQSVTAQGREGLVANRPDSRYEPGQRSGAWQNAH